ncbi:hypothetical protein D3C76_815920 [compost metagenome]
MVVMHEDPRVEHADAAVQTDLRQQLGARFGDHHVAGDDRHTALELPERTRHPGVQAKHHAVGADAATGSAHLRRRAMVEGGHGRAFVNAHTALQRDPPQAPHQPPRLHGGGGRREPAFQMPRRAGQVLHLRHWQTLERIDPLLLQRRDHRIGGAELGPVGGGVQRTVQAKVAVDAVAGAELTDGADATFRFAHQPHRLGHPEQPFEGEVLGRPGQCTAAIAPAGTGAADVGLDQQHVQRWLRLLEHQRRPQAGIAAADDAHIATGIALQRRAHRLLRRIQGLLQPEGSHSQVSFKCAVA